MSWAVEIESPVSAVRIFEAAILDWHNLGPEIAPEVFVSATIEGNVRQFNFTSGMPFSYVKERLDFVDRQTLECQTTIIEGGPLGTRLESAYVTYKIVEATSGEGCTIKVVVTTKPLPDIELIDEATWGLGLNRHMTKHFKMVQTYLLANPEKYNDLTPEFEKLNLKSGSIDDDAVGSGDDDSHSREVKVINVMIQANGKVMGNATMHSGHNVHHAAAHTAHHAAAHTTQHSRHTVHHSSHTEHHSSHTTAHHSTHRSEHRR